MRKIGVAEAGLFASPGYIERRGQPRRIGDLAAHDCVGFRGGRGKTTWRLLGSGGREESIEVTASVTADDALFVLRAVEAGAGIGLLPLFLAASAPAGGLVRLLPRHRVGIGMLSVVLPTSRYLPARVSLLRDWLVENIRLESRRAATTSGRRNGRRSTRSVGAAPSP